MRTDIHAHESIFILKSVLGHCVDENSTDSVIRACVSKAYDDMNTVGRFYSANRNKIKFIDLYLNTVGGEKYKYKFSIDLIHDISKLFGGEQIKTENGSVTTFGLSQKIVNMTYKYLYIFRQYTGLDIDFSGCHCPIDSNVLKKLGIHDIVWSKLEYPRYKEIQDNIHNLLSNDKLYADHIVGVGYLAFDFYCW